MKKIHVMLLFILSDETNILAFSLFFDRFRGNNNYGEGATDYKTMSLGV